MTQPPSDSLFTDLDAPALMPTVVRVLLPMPLDEPFDYSVPAGLELAAGDHVLVPLGPREVHGVVWGESTAKPGAKTKPVIERLDLPPLTGEARRFIDWMAHYICASPGVVLRMHLRGAVPGPLPVKKRLIVTGRLPQRMTGARQLVLDLAEGGGRFAPGALAEAAGVSPGVVAGLEKEGCLRAVELPATAPPVPPDPSRPGLALREDQVRAVESLRAEMALTPPRPVLLDGITGSGKTEVYLEAMRDVLARDAAAQVLLLVPEIALTQALLARIEARFGAAPTGWHSGMSGAERRAHWRFVADGRARIIVGARSALFLPFAHLSLIIVDEEHDGSYKQDEGVCYHARDLAVVRARMAAAPVVFATATPSLETIANVRRGRYGHVVIRSRAGSAGLPDVELVDLLAHPPEPERWLSPPLVEAVTETLRDGDQVLLYLNRRGYAPLVLCRQCGHRMTAPDTDSWLVEHRYTGQLVCHRTGFSMPKPTACPNCHAADSLHAIGPGVERLMEEVRERFPEARAAIFSSDTAPHATAIAEFVKAMEEGQIDILIGTQIVAKGHNFPHLTLVGVVDADLALRGGDLRAAERTAQVVTQVAGRAGRADKPGRALIQTTMPTHPALAALARHDTDGFIDVELAERELAGMPPFSRLALFTFASRQVRALEDTVRAAARAVPTASGIDVSGPADPPIALINGEWRKRFLIQAALERDLSAFMRDWKQRLKIPASVRIQIDIDPYSFL